MLEKNNFKISHMQEQVLKEEDSANIKALEEFFAEDPQLEGVEIKPSLPFAFEIYYLPIGFDLSNLPIPQRSGYRFLYWSEVNVCREEAINKVKDQYRAIKPCWQKLIYLDACDISISLEEMKKLDEKTLITLTRAKIVNVGSQKKYDQIEIVDFDWPNKSGSYDLVLGIQDTDIYFTVQVEIKDF